MHVRTLGVQPLGGGTSRQLRRRRAQRHRGAYQHVRPAILRLTDTTSHQTCDLCGCRIQQKIQEEQDPEIALKLRRFQKGLKAAAADVASCQAIFSKFEDTQPEEHEALVAGMAGQLSPTFFEYVRDIAAALVASNSEEDQRRREEVVTLGTRIMTLLQVRRCRRQQRDVRTLPHVGEATCLSRLQLPLQCRLVSRHSAASL